MVKFFDYSCLVLCFGANSQKQLDKLLGLAMLIVASAVFLYYTTWTILMVTHLPPRTLQMSHILVVAMQYVSGYFSPSYPETAPLPRICIAPPFASSSCIRPPLSFLHHTSLLSSIFGHTTSHSCVRGLASCSLPDQAMQLLSHS